MTFVFQGIASSIKTARKAASKNETSPQSLLLGSLEKMTMLDEADRMGVASTLNVPIQNVPEFAFTSKKCFLPDKGFEGTVCSSGESVIVLIAQREVVMKVDKFLSVKDNTNSYKLLVKGYVYDYVCMDNGHPVKQYWSGLAEVNSNPHAVPVFLTVINILRKVFLYSSSCQASSVITITVVEYQRCLKEFPFDIVVPVFPEKGDMLLVQGAEVGDVWYGHARNVNSAGRTVDVYFYVESPRMPNIFVRESFGRIARNTVPWDSLLGIADGHWQSSSQWQRAIQ